MNYSCHNKNDPNELYQYGEMLYKGLKVRRNKIAAAQYFKASADKGNLNAMIKYARMLYKGDGIAQNKEESIRYFKMAKEKRNQISKMYRPFKPSIDTENIESTKKYSVNYNDSPRLTPTLGEESNKNKDTYQIQDSNDLISENSNLKNQSNLIPNQIRLPSIHNKNQPKINRPNIKSPRSQLPPIRTQIEATQQQKAMLNNMTRLPQNYVPVHYDLCMNISMEKQLFEASLTVTLQQNNYSGSCYFNVSDNIEIISIAQNGDFLNYVVNYPILMIFKSNCSLSSFPITIKYTVRPNMNSNKGFISSGNCYLTSFEPNFARCFLPCFDEPFLRSTFKVTLRIPSNLVGLSNMPIESMTSCNDMNELVFQTTPPISSYLLSVCVGNFEVIEEKTISEIPIKIYSLSGQEKKFSKIFKVVNYAVDWIESNFNVKCELPHLQLVFHPSFRRGSEKYGMFTFSDDFEADSFDSIFAVVGEIIHLWFGDIVSIKWWNSVWLNEGFGTFLPYLVISDFGADFDVWNDFTEKRAIKSLNFFRTGLIAPPENNVDFENIFGPIIFEKGSFVLKMFYDIVGRRNFFKVCSKWLNHYKNKTVELFDFVSLVKNALKKNYANFFNPWLKYVGFPTLFVDEIIDENDVNHFIGINIKQVSKNKRYYLLKVPVLYELNGELKKLDLVIDNEITTKLVEFDWIFVNDEIQALCFVVYSNALDKKLNDVIEKKKLSYYNNYLFSESKKSQNPVRFFKSNV